MVLDAADFGLHVDRCKSHVGWSACRDLHIASHSFLESLRVDQFDDTVVVELAMLTSDAVVAE